MGQCPRCGLKGNTYPCKWCGYGVKMNYEEEAIREYGKAILVYIGKQVETDSIDHVKTVQYVNAIPIKGIVSDITSEQALWKMSGVRVSKAKLIHTFKRHADLLRLSHKIVIEGETYYGYKDHVGKNVQLKSCGEAVECLVYQEA